MRLRLILVALFLVACSSGQDDPSVPTAVVTTNPTVASEEPLAPRASASASAVASASTPMPAVQPSAQPSASVSATAEVSLSSDSGGTGKGFKNETELAKYIVTTAEKMAADAVRNAYPSDALLDKVITCKDPKEDQKLEVRRQIAKAIKDGPPPSVPFTYVSSSTRGKETLEKGKTYGSCTVHMSVSTFTMSIEVKDKDGKPRLLKIDVAKVGDKWFVDE